MDKKPSLTAETLLTALAVLVTGCGKKEAAPSAVAEPEKQAPAAQAASAESPPPPVAAPIATPSAPGADPTAPQTAAAKPAVAPPKPVKTTDDGQKNKKSHAACGAGQCSPDMKKGN